MPWTTEHILALAPDNSSLKAAQKLLTLSKWATLGADERALWGECQGSGSKPYLTRISLAEPAFKCSCPSRKFPCKHALALFLLHTEQTEAFSTSDPPGWVSDWLAERSRRAESQTKRAETEVKKVADPEAAAQTRQTT